MATQKILRRNSNIRERRKRGMTYRALGRMFKLSGMQIWNICNKDDHEIQELAQGEGHQ